VLLVFGVLSLASIWVTGALVGRHLRPLIITSSVLFAAACRTLALFAQVPWLVDAGTAAWGLAFGEAATLLQTATAEAVGSAVDVAVSLSVTRRTIGIAAGALLGGVLLSGIGSTAVMWAALVLLAFAPAVTLRASQNTLPRLTRRRARESAT
jgi:predicted MFS family arabinose efflux permease